MRNVHWQSIESYQTLIKALANLSFERALGTVFHVAGTISNEGHDRFVRTHHMGEYLLGIAVSYEGYAMEILNKMRNYILDNRQTKRDLLTGIMWYRRCDYYVKTIYWLSDEVMIRARNNIDEDITTYSNYVITSCVIIIFTGSLLMPMIFEMARKTSKTLTGYTLVMEKKSVEVRKEERKTENILNQMLPRAVSQR